MNKKRKGPDLCGTRAITLWKKIQEYYTTNRSFNSIQEKAVFIKNLAFLADELHDANTNLED